MIAPLPGAFLVGASRSGSTMVSQMLRTHGAVLSLSELLALQGARGLLPGRMSGEAFWAHLARPTPLMRVVANPDTAPDEFLYHRVPDGRFDPYNCPPILAATLPHLSNTPDALFDCLADQVPHFPVQDVARHYHRLFAVLAAETGTRVWAERSGGSLIALPSLAHLFPKAGFVLIARDGRDVALSMQRYKPARFAIWFWGMARRFGIDVLAPGAHIGRARWIAWTERLAYPVLPIRRILNTPPSLQECAAFWSAMMAHGLAAFQALPPARRLCLDYADLVANPRHEMRRLAEFLQIEADPNWLDRIATIPRDRPPKRLSLPDDAQAVLETNTAQMRQAMAAFLAAQAKAEPANSVS